MKEMIEHLAYLARIALSPKEQKEIKQYLQDMQEFVMTINNVPMSEEEIMSPYTTEGSLRLREDIPGNVASVNDLAELSPHFSDGGYIVPRIMDESE